MDKETARRTLDYADQLLRGGNVEQALNLLDRLDRIFPDNKEVRFRRAVCLSRLGRLGQAREICNQLASSFSDDRISRLSEKLNEMEASTSAGAPSMSALSNAAADFDNPPWSQGEGRQRLIGDQIERYLKERFQRQIRIIAFEAGELLPLEKPALPIYRKQVLIPFGLVSAGIITLMALIPAFLIGVVVVTAVAAVTIGPIWILKNYDPIKAPIIYVLRETRWAALARGAEEVYLLFLKRTLLSKKAKVEITAVERFDADDFTLRREKDAKGRAILVFDEYGKERRLRVERDGSEIVDLDSSFWLLQGEGVPKLVRVRDGLGGSVHDVDGADEPPWRNGTHRQHSLGVELQYFISRCLRKRIELIGFIEGRYAGGNLVGPNPAKSEAKFQLLGMFAVFMATLTGGIPMVGLPSREEVLQTPFRSLQRGRKLMIARSRDKFYLVVRGLQSMRLVCEVPSDRLRLSKSESRFGATRIEFRHPGWGTGKFRHDRRRKKDAPQETLEENLNMVLHGPYAFS